MCSGQVRLNSVFRKQSFKIPICCVIIRWSLDNPQKRDFLPRLGAGIKQVSVANNNLCIGIITADNAVQILNPQFHTLGMVQHLVTSSTFTAGILFDNRSKCLVMNGLDGHLQFYSILTREILHNVSDFCTLLF